MAIRQPETLVSTAGKHRPARDPEPDVALDATLPTGVGANMASQGDALRLMLATIAAMREASYSHDNVLCLVKDA